MINIVIFYLELWFHFLDVMCVFLIYYRNHYVSLKSFRLIYINRFSLNHQLRALNITTI